MDYTSDPSSNQHPNGHDYDQLGTIYAHLDSTTTASNLKASRRAPPAMNEIDLSGPQQWGRRIRGSRARGHSVYELNFGRGHKVFTFVTWAR